MAHLREVFQIQARALRGRLPTMEEWRLLDGLWAGLLANRLQTSDDEAWPPPRKDAATNIYVCTDASESSWSWVQLVDGKCVRLPDGKNPHGAFPKGIAELKIFYKELYATVMALKALKAAGHRNCNVIIVGDNRGVIGALSKMMGPPEAWAMLDEIRDMVRECNWSPITRWVESEGNVAHSWTHEEPIETERETRTWCLAVNEEYVPVEGTQEVKKK